MSLKFEAVSRLALNSSPARDPCWLCHTDNFNRYITTCNNLQLTWSCISARWISSEVSHVPQDLLIPCNSKSHSINSNTDRFSSVYSIWPARQTHYAMAAHQTWKILEQILHIFQTQIWYIPSVHTNLLLQFDTQNNWTSTYYIGIKENVFFYYKTKTMWTELTGESYSQKK